MRLTFSIVLVLSVGCGPHPGAKPDAAGHGGDGAGTAACDHQLTALLRDFRSDHPDFEHNKGDDRGILSADLGADGTPVFALSGPSATVSGPASFAQWYHDTPGVNLTFQQMLPLVENPPGTFTYDNQAFFPLDGMGWPAMGYPDQQVYGHNFWFTTEIHGTFSYQGGEQLVFDGDDDLWVFVNNRLALDLGGVHVAETATIDFDAMASQLGLTIGGTYSIAAFHAERHTDQSHFRMSTTVQCIAIE